MTVYDRRWALTYIRKNWDGIVPTADCPYCDGTGMVDRGNECGFCEKDNPQPE